MAVSTTSAPGTISSGSINTLPDWYTNYAKTVSNVGQGIAESLPGYNGYTDATGNPVPTVAGLSGTQQGGISSIKANAGSFAHGMSTAAGTATSGVGAVNNGLSTLGGAVNPVNAAGSSFAKAGGMVDSAMGSINHAQGQIDSASGSINNMGGALTKAQTYLDPAAAYMSKGTNGSEYSPAAMSQYMNPYTSGVTSEIARLGNQNLTENVLPAVNSTFTGAGQFGSTRNGEFNARAIRDNNYGILGQQSKVLADAQAQALTQAGASANRDLQAGQQTGALSTVAQGVAQGFGNQAGAQLSQGQDTLATANGQLAGSGQANATGSGQINQGVATGQIGNDQVNAGSQLGGLSQIQSGQAQAGHNMGLQDGQAQLLAGGLEQSTNQKGLDAAHADFLDRRDYVTNTLGALSQVMPGISGKVSPNQQQIQVNQTQKTDPLQSISDLINGLGVDVK
jgi:hypothetical protein